MSMYICIQEAFSHKIAARPERRRQFEKELISSVGIASDVLTACLSLSEFKEQVLEAFASWIRLRPGIPSSTLACHPLVLNALSSLSSELLSEASVNVISELIHYTTAKSSGGLSAQMPLIQLLVPHVMRLTGHLKDPSKDEEDVKAIARLFADMGDSYVELIATVISELIHYTTAKSSGGLSAQMPLIQLLVPHVMRLTGHLKDPSKDEEDVKAIARLFADMGDSYVELIATGSAESMMIVQALIDVASHPEYDIASMTFNFWHNLQVYLTERDSYISYGNEVSIEAERSRRLQIFCSPYEALVSLVSFRVQYPEDHQNLSKEDLKDFKQTRYAVGDVLIDAASILGGEVTLKILYMKLVEAVGTCRNDEMCDWRPAEAALYCIRAISDHVSFVDTEVMPQVMDLLSKLPHQPQLLHTVCLTIGAYSKWLDAAPGGFSALPSVIDILMSGMSTSEDSAAAAALAFRHICDDCRQKLCGSLDGLFHIYHRAVSGEGGYKISAEEALYLVEALSVVITELPPDHAKKALEALCLPVVSPLQEVINQGPVAVQKIIARELTIHIDRLGNIFRYVNHPEAVADAIHRLWPIFKAIFDHRAWDMRTMEALCRACKYAVKTSGKFMGATIGVMLEEIQGLYHQHHQPCFLYLSSEVIKIFGSDPSCANYLRSLLEALFSHTTHLLTKIQDFTSRPDIADDCFLLASRCIRYCPLIFVPSPVFPSLVDCAMIGVTIQHREACTSILTFLSDVFDLGNSSRGEQFKSIRDNVVVPRGASLTRILIASLTGALPSSRLDVVTYTLLALIRAYGVKSLEWVEATITLIPLTAVTEVEKSRFLQAMSEAASGIDISAHTGPIEELSDICRRNRGVQEIVQGALRPLELNIVPVS
ncbi:Transportin mos14 [Thalictrum thalictroides]|uniref:Transportin mos14 n=1 Tax=Thalictrum thalictroides TaxID=46969 RepID=A0A7J6WH68_THATH|nr:Transportin mos14 [Thalictrum thalictroides]